MIFPDKGSALCTGHGLLHVRYLTLRAIHGSLRGPRLVSCAGRGYLRAQHLALSAYTDISAFDTQGSHRSRIAPRATLDARCSAQIAPRFASCALYWSRIAPCSTLAP